MQIHHTKLLLMLYTREIHRTMPLEKKHENTKKTQQRSQERTQQTHSTRGKCLKPSVNQEIAIITKQILFSVLKLSSEVIKL